MRVCEAGGNRFSDQVETLSELRPYYVHLRPVIKYFRPTSYDWIYHFQYLGIFPANFTFSAGTNYEINFNYTYYISKLIS